MVDFISEVEEELRKDQYNALLKKWGPWLAGLAVAIVLGAAVYEWQKAGAGRIAKSTSISYAQAYNALEDGERDAALKEFMAISEKAKPGYAGLSLMQAAAIELDAGRKLEAIALFDRAAGLLPETRHKHLAQLKAAYILADEGRFDDVQSRLVPLSEKGAPFEFLARELRAFTALEAGDLQTARSQFSLLSLSPAVTEGIRARAEQMMALTPSLAELSDKERADAAAAADPAVTPPAPAGPDATPKTSPLETPNANTAPSDTTKPQPLNGKSE